MDFTPRMTALLSRFRRDRNGAEADAMRPVGKPCGLNYGVCLPDVRSAARAETPDHDFARYLFLQDVRELRLSALHIARPECLTPDELPFWAAGITNSELAAEAAFALLSRADTFPLVFDAWITSDDLLLVYASLMAAPRSKCLTISWLEPSAEALRRTCAADTPPARLVAEGAVALFAALGAQNATNRQAVLRAAGSLSPLPAGKYLLDELAWRLE